MKLKLYFPPWNYAVPLLSSWAPISTPCIAIHAASTSLHQQPFLLLHVTSSIPSVRRREVEEWEPSALDQSSVSLSFFSGLPGNACHSLPSEPRNRWGVISLALIRAQRLQFLHGRGKLLPGFGMLCERGDGLERKSEREREKERECVWVSERKRVREWEKEREWVREWESERVSEWVREREKESTLN